MITDVERVEDGDLLVTVGRPVGMTRSVGWSTIRRFSLSMHRSCGFSSIGSGCSWCPPPAVGGIGTVLISPNGIFVIAPSSACHSHSLLNPIVYRAWRTQTARKCLLRHASWL